MDEKVKEIKSRYLVVARCLHNTAVDWRVFCREEFHKQKEIRSDLALATIHLHQLLNEIRDEWISLGATQKDLDSMDSFCGTDYVLPRLAGRIPWRE